MKRLLVLLMAVAAVGIGATVRPVPHGDASLTSRQAALDWARTNLLTLRASEDLTRDGIYVLHRFTTADRCDLTAVPLGRPDEVMPLLEGRLGHAETHMLLASTAPMPDTVFGIHFRRLITRITAGHSPQPVLLAAAPGCVRPEVWAGLTEWPAP